jgi:hypothetical protein
MQQHDFDVPIHGEEQRLNRSQREEVVPRYKWVSPLYYKKEHENEELEKKAQNFELHIHYEFE